METRKIQRVSNGTFTVSLPREWAESQGVTAGTVVDLHTHIDGLLVVQAPEREYDSAEKTAIEVTDGRPNRVEQTIRAAYAGGHETVVLDAGDGLTPEQRRAVRRVTRSLAGMTVDEESDNRVVVRNLLDAGDVSVRQSVRHLQFVALSMHREATAALTGDGCAEAVTDRDDESDRLYAMVDRQFGRGLARLDEIDALGVTRQELFRLHATARELNRIADHAERIARVASAVDDPTEAPATDDVAAVAATAREAVTDAVDTVVADADAEAAFSALAARDRVREEADRIDRRLFEASDCEYRLTRALDSVRQTAEHAATVAQVGLRTAVRRGELTETQTADDGSDDGDDRPSASSDD